MQNLKPNQRIHQARIALYPVADEGQATWSFTTVRYTHGGRVPEILTEQSGLVLCPSDISAWAAIEMLHTVVAELRGPCRG